MRMLRDHFDVVDVVADGVTLIQRVHQLQPDIVLSDVGLRGLDGISAATAIHLRFPAIPVVLVTAQDDPSFRDKALRAGAAAFLNKSETGSFVDILQQLLAGS